MNYQAMKDKLYKGHKKIANNTYLKLEYKPSFNPNPNPNIQGEESIVMYLHGHNVATFTPQHLELRSCGWQTVTTKDRLNLALSMVKIHGCIYQQAWTWYYARGYKFDKVCPFREGMKISYEGEPIQ